MKPAARSAGSGTRADNGGRAAQEVGRALGLGVEVEELLYGGTQVGVAGALLVQERAAFLAPSQPPAGTAPPRHRGMARACPFRSRAS